MKIRALLVVAGVLTTALAAALIVTSCSEHNPLYCTTDADCLDPNLPHCWGQDEHQCHMDPHPDGGPIRVDGGQGQECGTSADCHGVDAPVCGDDHKCRPCVAADDGTKCTETNNGTTPHCDSTGGRCVTCRVEPSTVAKESSDCSNPQLPICESEGACRQCKAHAECGSGICKDDGTCAASSEVAIVDNGGMSFTDCKNGRGSRNGTTVPYCDVTEAVSGTWLYVLVKGSASPYGNISLTRSITIVGPGATASPTARLFNNGNNSVDVSGASSVVVLDGLDLGGDSSHNANNAVKCHTDAARLTVRNSRLHDCSNNVVYNDTCTASYVGNAIQGAASASAVLVVSGTVTLSSNTISGAGASGIKVLAGTATVRSNSVTLSNNYGLEASAGTISVDANTISGNAYSGLYFSGNSAFVVTNNIISGNGKSSNVVPGGVSIADAAMGQFAFNTVVKNLSSGIGGITSSSGVTIQDSIVWGNSLSGGTQLGAMCTLMNVVTGTDSHTGATQLDPAFVSPTDFHLKADPANDTCCVDKISADPGTPAKDHDVDGSARPKGKGWDIGAHELK